MTVIYTMRNDAELSKLIWPAFKESLVEKHGSSGEIGLRGEDNAAKILCNKVLFPDLTVVVKHEDAFHQIKGVDITTFDKDSRSDSIDVKAGSSALYWTSNTGWYMTFKQSWFTSQKVNTTFMHLGPKGDVFAMYNRVMMKEWVDNNPRLLTPGRYGTILVRKYWPQFVRSNL